MRAEGKDTIGYADQVQRVSGGERSRLDDFHYAAGADAPELGQSLSAQPP
jgi:hypothetical protein